eukprot:3448293-Pleurochrysis_carterae.AAC.2
MLEARALTTLHAQLDFFVSERCRPTASPTAACASVPMHTPPNRGERPEGGVLRVAASGASLRVRGRALPGVLLGRGPCAVLEAVRGDVPEAVPCAVLTVFVAVVAAVVCMFDAFVTESAQACVSSGHA